MKRVVYILMMFVSFNSFAIDRFALVIGNGGYSLDPLENTINDANDVSESFSKLGYTVFTVIDGNREAIESAVTNLSRSVSKDSMIVFYYAGHAAQADKTNYLIPVEENIHNENDLKYKSVNLDWVLGSLKSSQSRTNIIVLDSCRDNPFRDTTRGGSSRGLTVVSAPATTGAEIKNTAIIYATTDGNTADDGNGRNSPFTTAFLKYMGKKNETVLDVMTYVTQAVFTGTEGRQEPTMTNALKEKVYFMEPEQIVPLSNGVINRFGLEISAGISGKLFINGQFVTNIINGQVKELLDMEIGLYDLEFITDEYSEIITVNIDGHSVVPVVFNNFTLEAVASNTSTDIEQRIEQLTSEKEYLGITRGNLLDDINSLEDQMALHVRYRRERDQRKKTAFNAGLFSFVSYVGAGAGAYFAYENYQRYNETNSYTEAVEARDTASKLVIVAAGATLSGVISSIVSKYNSKKVIEYDLQQEIFLAQLDSKRVELADLNKKYNAVVQNINRLQLSNAQ